MAKLLKRAISSLHEPGKDLTRSISNPETAENLDNSEQGSEDESSESDKSSTAAPASAAKPAPKRTHSPMAIPPEPASQSKSSGAKPADTSTAPRSPNVLIVDDNNINLQLLVMFMKKQKYTYTEAHNGLEALNAYKAASQDRSKPFDYILMDISMPVMDGLESSREIRKHEQAAKLEKATIIALTGLASAQAQEEAKGSGVDFYLAKPVKFAELKKLLDVE